MEGSESETLLESPGLNPQLFINEILNSVDDLLDGAFDYFHQEAMSTMKTDGSERADDLSKGVGYIKRMVQTILDERLAMWETYCLRHCFVVPEGLTLSKSEDLQDGNSMDIDDIRDPKLDTELGSLREKLGLVLEESANLSRELQALEMQSSLSNSCAQSINEALQLYEQHSMDELFQDFVRTASDFGTKLDNLKTKRGEEYKRVRKEKMQISNGDLFSATHGDGLSNAKLEELQEFIADMRS